MTASKTNPHPLIVLDKPAQIAMYRLMVLRSGIMLELAGLRHSRGRWYMTGLVRKELGLDPKAKPKAVLAALETHIASQP